MKVGGGGFVDILTERVFIEQGEKNQDILKSFRQTGRSCGTIWKMRYLWGCWEDRKEFYLPGLWRSSQDYSYMYQMPFQDGSYSRRSKKFGEHVRTAHSIWDGDCCSLVLRLYFSP